ncbi:hypothetical protein PHYBOEH_004405 [Phytophthora boehmeriae]|uniref:endo-1,4-beta-xylanase n=1 Tax=Phytophthora boehmeriae TaxID=109152 RepID=A0A8T1WQY8_9STRA|nr:hypothetical protein PHYBOEH_004405 [Phytophthora boehmeriae]
MNLIVAVALLSTSLATVATGDAILESTYKGPDGLHDLAKAAGKYMGTATNLDVSDTYYAKQLKDIKDFGMITPTNAMKWDATEPEQGVFTFTSADQVVAIANESDAQVRCHALLWHQQVPKWVEGLEKADLLNALANHITKVMTHFGDSCYAWDVANECIADDGSYRQSFWYTKTGKEYIAVAFETAAAVKKSLGLKTKLYYNDYNINTINAKSTAILEMVQSLLKDGINVDGVGFQSHFSYSDTTSIDDQVKNFNRFTALGLDVALTELDVKTSSATPPAQEQNQQVSVYTNAIAACKQVEKCVGVTIWDFLDTYTWIKESAPLPWYQPGGKNTALVRKAAYDGIVEGWRS